MPVGSIKTVVTVAPLLPRQLSCLARRLALWQARCVQCTGIRTGPTWFSPESERVRRPVRDPIGHCGHGWSTGEPVQQPIDRGEELGQWPPEQDYDRQDGAGQPVEESRHQAEQEQFPGVSPHREEQGDGGDPYAYHAEGVSWGSASQRKQELGREAGGGEQTEGDGDVD